MTGEQLSFQRSIFHGWEAVRVEHGALALTLVPQVGGRVMGMEWRGRELSFINPAYRGRVEDVAGVVDVHARKQELGFVLWGGDKTWIAPQDRWTDEVPFLDLDSGDYALTLDEDAGTARMVSPVCRETGVQIERTLSFPEQAGSFSLVHTLCNRSEREVSWAPWDVAMISRPAVVYLLPREGSDYPEGVKTFFDEGDSGPLRGRVLEVGDGFAAISCREALQFKYGVDASVGSILAVLEKEDGGLIGLRKSVPTHHPQPYAHGCVAEVFNNGELPYFELELHGPVTTLAPGESFSLTESIAVFDMDAAPRDAEALRARL